MASKEKKKVQRPNETFYKRCTQLLQVEGLTLAQPVNEVYQKSISWGIHRFELGYLQVHTWVFK